MAKMVVVVPIGYRCMTSMAMRHFGFQQQSLPFDWLGAPLPSITEAIADDLQSMLLPEDIEPFLDIGPLEDHNRTVHNKYGMTCTHVFKKKMTGREQAETVLSTTKRRAERLLEILRGDSPVLFVRHQNDGHEAPSIDEWDAFMTIIRQKFPVLNFRILYIQVGKAPKVPIGVKLLAGDYRITPIASKFDDPKACCSETIRKVVVNMSRKLTMNS